MNEITNHNQSLPVSQRSERNTAAESGKKLPQSDEVPAKDVVEKPDVVQVSQESIIEALEKVNQYAQSIQRELHFSLDEEAGRTVVTVLDSQSKKVIRQIPDEVFLELARNLNVNLKQQGSDASLHLINTKA